MPGPAKATVPIAEPATTSDRPASALADAPVVRAAGAGDVPSAVATQRAMGNAYVNAALTSGAPPGGRAAGLSMSQVVDLLPRVLDDIPILTTMLRLCAVEPSSGSPWQDRVTGPRVGESPVPRSGTAGDLAAAVAATPGVDAALESAKAALQHDWRRLVVGDRWVVAAAGVTVAAPLLAHEPVRSILDGQTVPIPPTGSPWLDNVGVVLHTRGGGLGVGLQIDLVGLLRSRREGGVLGPSFAAGPMSRSVPARGSSGAGVSPALACLDQIARAGKPVAIAKPPGMAGVRAWAVEASLADAVRLARLGGARLPAELTGSGAHPPIRSVTVVYTNDGRGPFPNIGGGSDQELTASAHVRVDYANAGRGWTSAGLNFEIWTPLKGGTPTPLPDYTPGRYPGQPGPNAGGYRGLFYADFAYRISGTGTGDLTLLTRLGANSTWLGNEMQSNLVHRPLRIPLFDWIQEPTEPYAALGLRTRSVYDLTRSGLLRDAGFHLRLTLSAQALGGTHEAEGGNAAMLSLRSGFVRLGGAGRAAVELRFGVDGRGLVRYNDQGGERAGLEAAVSNEVRLQLRDLKLPWMSGFDVFAGGRSQQSTLPEGRTTPGEDRPGATEAWLGHGSKTQGFIGVEIQLR